MYWQRVDVQEGAETQTPTGNVRLGPWTDVFSDVEARLLPVTTTETLLDWATPEEDAYEVQLRGELAIVPRMRVLSDGDAYDIRKVTIPPPFGTPTTILHVVKVTP